MAGDNKLSYLAGVVAALQKQVGTLWNGGGPYIPIIAVPAANKFPYQTAGGALIDSGYDAASFQAASAKLAAIAALADGAGWLHNDGAGAFAYSTPSYSDVGAAAAAHNHAGVYEPVITAGTTAQYWRGDKSWQTLNQAAVDGLKTSQSPTFTGLDLTGLTDGYIPYVGVGALANSAITSNGTAAAIGRADFPAGYFSVTIPYAKTDTTGRNTMWLLSNEAIASNPAGLQIYMTGAAAQANRLVALGTGEYGVTSDGILALQPSGGKVGVGIVNPVDKFEVAGAVTFSGYAAAAKASSGYIDWYSTGVRLNSTGPDATHNGTFKITTYRSDFSNALTPLLINESGNVGIENAGSSVIRLWVTGQGATSGTYCLYLSNSTPADLCYVRNDGVGWLLAAAWNYGSDRRLKENITPINDNGLEKILALNPVRFDYIEGQKNQLGFIAQDLQKVIPEAVSVSNEKTGMLGSKTNFIIPFLVQSVKELKAENDSLKKRVGDLETTH